MKDLTNILVDPSEKILAVLGSSAVKTFLSTGTLGRGFAVLTDRRVYVKGSYLVRSGAFFTKKTEEKIVGIEDVTGTGIIHDSMIFLKALVLVGGLGVLTLLMFWLGWDLLEGYQGTPSHSFGVFLIFVAMGFVGWYFADFIKKNLSAFQISYAGGSIAFDMHFIKQEEADAFQKELQTVKYAARKPETAARPAPSAAADIPDQLKKYKALLDEGVITQEEYQVKKEELLKQ